MKNALRRFGTICKYVFVVTVAGILLYAALVPQVGGRRSSPLVKFAATVRLFGIGIANYRTAAVANGADEIPETWNSVFAYMVEGKPGDEEFAGPNVKDFHVGPIPTADIMAGLVGLDRVAEVARDLGIPDQSWEWVMGIWVSRMGADFRSESEDVIIACTRQHVRGDTFVVVLSASGAVHYGGRPPLRDLLAENTAARKRLGLAPFPPEFESWMLTGEPASVGEGTFVPPRLETEKDERE